ncbi:multiple epidermal growth factor-like domains protein 11 [Drosophila tropicalis]|uniref:multiple epidermal growth factor-like domains protein 11 n=1 Tax=Drosophila tropicalis TaxID=46794 RepID=UPI0035AB759A
MHIPRHKCFILLLLMATCGKAMELLELSCSTDDHCSKLERGKCRNSVCICTARDTEEEEPCRPMEDSQTLTNIVGGPCPCKQPHTECIEVEQQQKQCFCAEGYIPSVDRRRCLPEKVELDGRCEMDSQCQRAETFSVCHQSRCLCKTNFEPHQQRCRAVLDVKCLNNTVCETFGASVCMSNISKCHCSIDYVPNRNMTKCIAGAAYGENCSHNLTCQLSLGAAGQCREEDHRCACRAMHYPRRQVPAQLKGESQGIANKDVICRPIVLFGAYCRNDSDCQEQHAMKTQKEQGQEIQLQAPNPMRCMWGECRCGDNYTLVDNDKCIINGGAVVHFPAIFLIVIGSTLHRIFIGGI